MTKKVFDFHVKLELQVPEKALAERLRTPEYVGQNLARFKGDAKATRNIALATLLNTSFVEVFCRTQWPEIVQAMKWKPAREPNAEEASKLAADLERQRQENAQLAARVAELEEAAATRRAKATKPGKAS